LWNGYRSLVKKLRDKLGRDIIKTIPGIGLKIDEDTDE
jgi:DNA-binding winged helix-turn-helix (wHTH) protein